jgi:hypothetical protein
MVKLKEDGMTRFANFLTIVSLVLATFLISPAVAADKGDLTGDGFVDIDDVAVMAGDWLESSPKTDLAPISGDPNVSISDGDGIVNMKDFALLSENWGSESLVMSSNAMDFCLQQLLATEEFLYDNYDSYGIPKTVYSTENGYSQWDMDNGRTNPTFREGWTSGFFPGCLWYMYELTGDAFIKTRAMMRTEYLEEIKTFTWFSDQGFVFIPTYARGYRLGGPECSGYIDPIIMAAMMLAARYSPNVGCIDSCDWGDYDETFTTIIDTMMSIEILFWAAKNGAPSLLYDYAVNHSYKTRDEFVFPDGSHIQRITFDETTGEFIKCEWSCDPNTPWARGQAWGAHGFTIAYRETGDPNLLETAQSMSDYFIDHLPTDMVPPNYFNTSENKDTSAAAITASGLLELCTLVTDPCDQERYYNAAKGILTSLTTSYLDGGFMADAGDVCLLRESNGTTEAFIYGDYYFVEALMRYYDMTEF